MSDFELKLNSSGVKALLQSSGMQEEVRKHGQNVLSAAGEDLYQLRVGVMGDRAQATVSPSCAKGYYSNLKHNTLVKALHTGG